jgi:hypothetical protein
VRSWLSRLDECGRTRQQCEIKDLGFEGIYERYPTRRGRNAYADFPCQIYVRELLYRENTTSSQCDNEARRAEVPQVVDLLLCYHWAKLQYQYLFLTVIQFKIQAFIKGFFSNAVVVCANTVPLRCYPVCMGMSTTRYSTSTF